MFSNERYETLKLFLDQIALAVFGVVTAVASSRSPAFRIIFGVIGIGLYFYIIYATMWEIGAKDRIRVDAGRDEKKPAKPLVMGRDLIALGIAPCSQFAPILQAALDHELEEPFASRKDALEWLRRFLAAHYPELLK